MLLCSDCNPNPDKQQKRDGWIIRNSVFGTDVHYLWSWSFSNKLEVNIKGIRQVISNVMFGSTQQQFGNSTNIQQLYL